jgi:hypothetical protein
MGYRERFIKLSGRGSTIDNLFWRIKRKGAGLGPVRRKEAGWMGAFNKTIN